MKKYKRKFRISIIIFILGSLVIFYPIFAKTEAITKYTDIINNMEDDKIDKYKEKFAKYNEDLIQEKTSTINLLKKGEILGFIKIVKIKLNLPIYEGTDNQSLENGVGHLEKSMLPIKSLDYHSIFVGHNGISSKKIFDDLYKLEIGDFFQINILNEIFKYNVTSIKTIEPDDTGDLKVQSKKKQVTLVTCTPKYVNTHRLLIIGEEL